jgi:hypothetical protein
MSIIHGECVFVALVIQHAMRMRHNIIRCLPLSTIRILPHFLHKRQDIREKSYGTQIVYLTFSLQLSSETFRILRRNERDIVKM